MCITGKSAVTGSAGFMCVREQVPGTHPPSSPVSPHTPTFATPLPFSTHTPTHTQIRREVLARGCRRRPGPSVWYLHCLRNPEGEQTSPSGPARANRSPSGRAATPARKSRNCTKTSKDTQLKKKSLMLIYIIKVYYTAFFVKLCMKENQKVA